MIWIILPAYNEEESLPLLLNTIKETFQDKDYHYKVLVVNDGSTDKTLDVAHKYENNMPLEIFDHGKNMGLGKAILNGLKHALKKKENGDIIITLDADNTHPPSLFIPMINKINEGFDIVIASRYAKGGREVGLSPIRKVLSRTASIIIKSGFNVGAAKDCTCGFRAYKPSFLRKAFDIYGDNLVSESSFVCMSEILIKLSSLGASIDEVPLVLRYDMKKGSSKMKFIYTILRYINLILRKKSLLKNVNTD
ncbi:MAG: glycosyltransferase family 2 protein [Candidatus Schekmanbacteria bacterium]|nr:glycosyltransferase family 2 protein [Candidatus Schekmanbacteria bacterium]